MGASLALEAIGFSNQSQIPYAPRCLLIWMALRALDDASARAERPARRSFLRRSELALGLGRFMPDTAPGTDASEEIRLAWDADDQAVVRALRALKNAGAIRQVAAGRNGRTVEYEIHLGNEGSLSVPLKPTLSVPLGGRLVTFEPTLTVPPRSTEDYKEQQGGQDHLSAPSHLPVKQQRGECSSHLFPLPCHRCAQDSRKVA